jgi:hypothetical protein
VGKKHCSAICSCPNAHQLMRGAMETKMAAGWEYDEYCSAQKSLFLIFPNVLVDGITSK